MTYTNDHYIDALIASYIANKDIHSAAQVNFEQVFVKVWDRIQNPDKFQSIWANGVRPDTNDMIERLKQEIQESDGMCFTGRLTRLVNTLVGFYNDINMNISSTDQINARINQVLAKFGNLSIEEQKNKIRESLQEIQVESEKIEEWISNIWVSEEIS